MERIPDQPKQELLVAIAGPAVNVVLAVAAWAVARAFDDATVRAFAVQLFWMNASLAAFNVLPAFPMDGGRVARALLAMRLPRVRATEIAARLGQSIAVLFAIAGLFFSRCCSSSRSSSGPEPPPSGRMRRRARRSRA